MRRIWCIWCIWILLVLLLAACEGALDDPEVDAVKQRLVGTWLREYNDQATHVRRILILQADGKFREMSRFAAPGLPEQRESRAEGEWLFDGTNLKRHYVRINGKPLAALATPFATFELRFPSRFEFVGVDHVHKLEVHYERVEEGTQP